MLKLHYYHCARNFQDCLVYIPHLVQQRNTLPKDFINMQFNKGILYENTRHSPPAQHAGFRYAAGRIRSNRDNQLWQRKLQQISHYIIPLMVPDVILEGHQRMSLMSYKKTTTDIG